MLLLRTRWHTPYLPHPLSERKSFTKFYERQGGRRRKGRRGKQDSSLRKGSTNWGPCQATDCRVEYKVVHPSSMSWNNNSLNQSFLTVYVIHCTTCILEEFVKQMIVNNGKIEDIPRNKQELTKRKSCQTNIIIYLIEEISRVKCCASWFQMRASWLKKDIWQSFSGYSAWKEYGLLNNAGTWMFNWINNCEKENEHYFIKLFSGNCAMCEVG